MYDNSNIINKSNKNMGCCFKSSNSNTKKISNHHISQNSNEKSNQNSSKDDLKKNKKN
jgi:hypothetical protein